MQRSTRIVLPLALAPALLLVACLDRELPTATLAPGASFSLNAFDVGCGANRVAELIAAIEAANADADPNVIRLAPNCTYTLAEVDNQRDPFGTNGLPVITRPVTFEGNGARIERSPAAPAFRIFFIEDVAVSISGLTIGNGMANGDPAVASIGGGGIHNERGALTLSHSTLSDNSAQYGGGIFNNRGALTLIHGTVSDNRAGFGGGINNNHGTLTLTHSTLSGNHATIFGAGVYSETSSDLSTSTTILNSTISGNHSSVYGGGIFNGNGVTRIVHSTITGNRARDGGGGVYSSHVGTRMEVLNSLIWGNTINGTIANDVAANLGNRYVSLGYNLIGTAGHNVDFNVEFKASGDRTGVEDAELDEELADNGGPTRTHALLPGSLAIDAGTCVDHEGNEVETDQRGISRPQGARCDIGAFELEQAPPSYTFIGFTAPVENPGTLNVAKAGQTIPLKWRLLDGSGRPVTTLHTVAVATKGLDCGASSSTDPVGEYAAGKSGLQHLGEGFYQYNWSTPKGYAGSCRTLTLTLGDGIDLSRQALFQFTR